MSPNGVIEARKVSEAKKVRQCFTKTEGVERSAHVHAHALRIVAKRILKDVWCAWNPEKVNVFDVA